MKQLEIYSFNLAAGASMNLPVQGSYVRVISATGAINIIADTWGRLGPISRGQGLQNADYNRLTIQDASGAPNSGTILVSEADFIDQTTYGSFSIANAVALDAATLLALEQTTAVPIAAGANWNNTGAMVANTPITVFTPAANTNGAIIWTASAIDILASLGSQVFIAKTSAPTTSVDGEVIAGPVMTASSYSSTTLAGAQRIAAGLGLYFISSLAGNANGHRAARYTLL